MLAFFLHSSLMNAQVITRSADSTKDQINASIDFLMTPADDFGSGDRKLLLGLPVESIPVFVERLQHAQNGADVLRLMRLLSCKVAQFSGVAPEADRQAAVKAMVDKCMEATGHELRLRLGHLQYIDDPQIDHLIDKLAASQSAEEREAADGFLKGRSIRVSPTGQVMGEIKTTPK